MGTQKLLRLLISKGVDVDPQHDSGTPLQWAAAHRKQDAVKILLDHHANPNVLFHHMFTPPVASVFSELSECTLLLIQAITADPSDVSVLSNWSLCWVRLGQGERALGDAKECRFLRPDWPKACYREGAAWRLLKRLDKAAIAFYCGLKLDPENKDLQDAFWEAFAAHKQQRQHENRSSFRGS
ncbi:hsp70-Hsp90 organizing protein 3-like [Magnolia sinica]|uniref:hsp70-Hsp90 organizing protein 3-like n=1 Tax=Magnolia sinica TaxID=86752 RepID=UPI002658749D|nr:hsp70-Hsp90 organizing protein 3-like [Magnolia sinica]